MATKVLYILLISSFITPLVLSDVNHWSYSSQNDWPKLCRTGVRQSPIDIQSKNILINTTLFIDFKHYENDFQNFMITNNGHSAQLSIDFSGDDSQQPFITGIAVDNQVYGFSQMHFHWSDQRGRGSEHAINGHLYSMEMHIVHYNQKYDNITEAINHSDGLAVIGVLFEITRKENPHLDAIIEGVNFVKIEGSDDYKNSQLFRQNQRIPNLRIANLLPNDITMFYKYKGSLTTPPCAESVTWLVFHDTTDIGLKQIQGFRELMNSNKVVLIDTFRHLQTINDRKIEASKAAAVMRDGSTGLASRLATDRLITQLSLIASLLMLTKY